MLKSANELLHTKIQITPEIHVSLITLILRGISILLVGAWIAIYPAYLLVIYMWVEKFFSYDIFTDGVLGIKSFIMMVLILIIMASFGMWGFIMFISQFMKHKKKYLLGYVIACAILSILVHLSLFATVKSESYSRIVWLSAMGLLFMVSATLFFRNPLKNLVSNWWGPMIAVALSAVTPILSSDIAADVVRTGLENFKVGGNIKAQVYASNDNHVITEGKLLLLTPNYVYLRHEKKGHIAISRSNENYVKVE